jgi:hypothetical protein
MTEATKGFRRALLAAAVQEYDKGNLTRYELIRIRVATFLRPGKLRAAQDCVVDSAVAMGLMGDADAENDGFDWMALIALIVQLLPVIMELFNKD